MFHLLQIELVPEAIDEGAICGECPSDAPSDSPTDVPAGSPSSSPSNKPSKQPAIVPTAGQPTQSPTGPLEGCPLPPPPSCIVDPDDGEERVTFCLQLGDKETEECVLVENVQTLLDLGKNVV